MTDESQRLVRLIGNGATGGGLPLPVAFGAVVQELLDNGPADRETLTELVRDALAYKEKRILSAAWRTWEDFTRDILGQLCSAGVIEQVGNSSFYHLPRWFVPGQRYMVIPVKDIGITVWDKEVRAQRERNAALRLEVRRLLTQYERADPTALKYLADADEALGMTGEAPPFDDDSGEKPRKKFRHGMTTYFREFWKTAPVGEWFSIRDIALMWEKDNPDQPPVGEADNSGSMRKVARDMVEAGVLERRVTVIKGSTRKITYRKLPD